MCVFQRKVAHLSRISIAGKLNLAKGVHMNQDVQTRSVDVLVVGAGAVSYTHLTLPTIYSV